MTDDFWTLDLVVDIEIPLVSLVDDSVPCYPLDLMVAMTDLVAAVALVSPLLVEP